MRRWISALLAVALLLVARPAQGGAPPTQPPPAGNTGARAPVVEVAAHAPLADLFALVPDTEANRKWLAYGDINAWYAAGSVPQPFSLSDLDNLNEADRKVWLTTLGRQTALPDALGPSYLMLDEMRPVYGFDLFAVAQALEAGSPPGILTYTNLNLAAAPIAAALAKSDYTVTALPAATLYQHGEDYAVDMHAPTHMAQLGKLNRIAMLADDAPGSQLLIGRATDVITQSLAAQAGEVPSLADDMFYRTLADAVEHDALVPGVLAGLIVLGGMQPADPFVALGQAGEALQAQVEAYAQQPLPPYLLSAFGTYRDGADTYLTLFLPVVPGEDAFYAAAVVRDRLVDYISLAAEQPLGDNWTVYETGTFDSEATIGYVTLKLNPESTITWFEMIARRDLLFLTPGGADE